MGLIQNANLNSCLSFDSHHSLCYFGMSFPFQELGCDIPVAVFSGPSSFIGLKDVSELIETVNQQQGICVCERESRSRDFLCGGEMFSPKRQCKEHLQIISLVLRLIEMVLFLCSR